MHEVLHIIVTVAMGLVIIWCFLKIRKLKNENLALTKRIEIKKYCLQEAICTSNVFFKRCRELFKENKELKSKLSKNQN